MSVLSRIRKKPLSLVGMVNATHVNATHWSSKMSIPNVGKNAIGLKVLWTNEQEMNEKGEGLVGWLGFFFFSFVYFIKIRENPVCITDLVF